MSKTTRREFVGALLGGAASFLAARSAPGMQTTQTFAGPMEQSAYRPVKLAARAGAAPSMAAEQRDELEHDIKCQCGCVLDIYTCRTTDFTCAVSPAMHADVMGLVAGGYAAQEILNAFQAVYGEIVLMAPLRRGFNWVGYLMPFAALIAGGVTIAALIRRWGARGRMQVAIPAPVVDATPEELDALQAAVSDDR
ncbi:MAG: cytochrome c-type biogenesis protein CcmH [Gemmatimonadaceae bacterium]